MKEHRIQGAAETAAWLEERGLDASRTPHWYVEVTIPTGSKDTWIELNLYPEEWGIVFRRGGRCSSVRVTDVPFVHGLDDDRLLPDLPPLERIDLILTALEGRYDVEFQRLHATVKSNLVRAATIVRAWLATR